MANQKRKRRREAQYKERSAWWDNGALSEADKTAQKRIKTSTVRWVTAVAAILVLFLAALVVVRLLG